MRSLEPTEHQNYMESIVKSSFVKGSNDFRQCKINSEWCGVKQPCHYRPTSLSRAVHEYYEEAFKYYIEPLMLPKKTVYKDKESLDAGITLICNIKRRRENV